MAHQLGSFAFAKCRLLRTKTCPFRGTSLATLNPLRPTVSTAHYTYASLNTSGYILHALEVLPEISGPI